MQIKRVSYTGKTPDEVYRWVNHVVEDVVLQYLRPEPLNHIDLKVSRHIGGVEDNDHVLKDE